MSFNVLLRTNMKKVLKIIIIGCILIAIGLAVAYFYLPVNRVGITSELIMIGDLNNDKKWDNKDEIELKEILKNPFIGNSLTLTKVDLNKNRSIDEEDITYLKYLYDISNPYKAQMKAQSEGKYFPKPREVFQYLPKYEYIQRPLFLLNHKIIDKSPFQFLQNLNFTRSPSFYENQLLKEIYNEALRFSFAFDIRNRRMTETEREYVQIKIDYCSRLYKQKKYYELLLNLISLVEDAETLTVTSQSDFIKNILYAREKLKKLLTSDDFISFVKGEIGYSDIFIKIENILKAELNMSIELNSLPSPRDFSSLENYLDRAEWQVFKSKTKEEDFKQLVLYAQYDRRYLRAVSKTSPKHEDIQLENHNLPMILLFREALRIKGDDKKAALGLLDEAVRIPMGWVKSIPKKMLPSSIALENFLLPGNMEDGSDKTRHWNVFGGVAIYKCPEDSLTLALKREIMDLKFHNYSPEAMQEFLRDTIANINGIYYVVSINRNLLIELNSGVH